MFYGLLFIFKPQLSPPKWEETGKSALSWYHLRKR